MGNAGLCPHCGGSGTRWTGDRLVWCRCSGRHGTALDPVLADRFAVVPVADWPAVRDRLVRR